jgi:hypothetical protein
MSTITTTFKAPVMNFKLATNFGKSWKEAADRIEFEKDFDCFEMSKYENETLGAHHFKSPGKYNPPIGFYAQVSCASVAASDLRHLVGKDGYYIDVMTLRSEVDYIWLNKERRVFEIYSEVESSLADAERRCHERVTHVNDRSASFTELNEYEGED